ncbi:hypothetical protein [Escherichia sp. E2593]|uniref:hypothetical protein n=1 Tax=Escherichia sp. E2593 TaxID=2044458 RepID=UPI00107F91D4|nr:hypothetical protein [Escherichia sp. E2593]
MLPSVYKKKNKKHFGSSPSRLTLLSTIIGALLSNAYASTSSEKIDLDGKEQIETSDIDIDTGVKNWQKWICRIRSKLREINY